MAQCAPQDLLAIANCFQCLPPGQIQLVTTALLCQILKAINPMAVCNIDSLLQSASCFQCLPAGQLALIQTQLLCEILHAGGGSGTCLTCGSGAPVGSSTCNAAIYYDCDSASPTVGSFWWWSVMDNVWYQFLFTGQ